MDVIGTLSEIDTGTVRTLVGMYDLEYLLLENNYILLSLLYVCDTY